VRQEIAELAQAVLDVVETLADKRPGRRKWERAVNAYQGELGTLYDKWATALAASLAEAETDDEADEIIAVALLALAASMKEAGRDNITQGALLALGSTAASGAFLKTLGDRVEANDDYIDVNLLPDIRFRLQKGLQDPDIRASGAVAILGLLAAYQARVESYAGSMWTAMQEAQGETARVAEESGEGGRVAWQRDEQAQHCDDCIEYGEDEFPGREYDSWDDMLAQTGNRIPGEVQCSANCRCTLWVEVDGEWTRG
jgi:hypothetical protein